MKNENFEKLFTKEHQDSMIAIFSKSESQKLREAKKSEKREMVKQRHVQISPELDEAIQRYINANKGRVQGKQLRQMVKKQFGITVV